MYLLFSPYFVMGVVNIHVFSVSIFPIFLWFICCHRWVTAGYKPKNCTQCNNRWSSCIFSFRFLGHFFSCSFFSYLFYCGQYNTIIIHIHRQFLQFTFLFYFFFLCFLTLPLFVHFIYMNLHLRVTLLGKKYVWILVQLLWKWYMSEIKHYGDSLMETDFRWLVF